MGFTCARIFGRLLVIILTAASLTYANAPALPGAPVPSAATFGTIKGIVRDDGGNPIADATVAIFKASRLLKQVRAASRCRFVAKILPGTYTIFAVAEGFNPVTLADVEISGASQLVYGFKLERAGSGNTLPEKRLDRNNPKWVIRSAPTH